MGSTTCGAHHTQNYRFLRRPSHIDYKHFKIIQENPKVVVETLGTNERYKYELERACRYSVTGCQSTDYCSITSPCKLNLTRAADQSILLDHPVLYIH